MRHRTESSHRCTVARSVIHRSPNRPVESDRRPQCADVHARIDPSPDLLRLATHQSGVLSAEQALGHGLSRASLKRLVDQGAWRRLTRGVFHLGVGEPTWTAQVWAGTLVGGDRSRVGFTAAGHLWGIVPEPPSTLTVLVPHEAVLRDQPPWVFRRERPRVRQVQSPGGPPRTTLEDTVIDLASEATPRELVEVVTNAIQSRRTTARRVLACADRRARLPHRADLIELLADVAEGAESPLELRYLRDVQRRHQLPPALRQDRSSRRRAVRDLRYEKYALLIELDGRTHVPGRFRDMRRDNGALLDGEVTLRYGWHDVADRPCQVAWEVGQLLSSRGWPGRPSRCSWCGAADLGDLG